MRVVLYDDETMEPLTVLHLEGWMAGRLREGERMALPLIRKFTMEEAAGDIPVAGPIKRDRVYLWFEKFRRNGVEHWFCFTRDSEDALSLRGVFLPGQWPAVHKEYQRGVREGIERALEAIFR